METVAKAKKMPADSFRRFGGKTATRGREKRPCARVDVYDAKGEIHSYFDIEPGRKGKFKPGKGSSGMFFPGQLPQHGETWHLVEGVKDAAALDGMGLLAAGLPRADMPADFAEMFRGCDVVILPDLDTAGQNGAILWGEVTGTSQTSHIGLAPRFELNEVLFIAVPQLAYPTEWATLSSDLFTCTRVHSQTRNLKISVVFSLASSTPLEYTVNC